MKQRVRAAQVGMLPLRNQSTLTTFHKILGYLYGTADSAPQHGNPFRKSWSSSLFADTTVGVFHLRSPLGQYKMTYEQAKEACANESATIATYNQLLYAQKVRRPLEGRRSPKRTENGQGGTRGLLYANKHNFPFFSSPMPRGMFGWEQFSDLLLVSCLLTQHWNHLPSSCFQWCWGER